MKNSISRFASFFLDFLIAVVFLAVLDTLIGPKLSELENYLGEVIFLSTPSTIFTGRTILVYLIFFIIQLYSVLYFGITLGQLAFGIKVSGTSFLQIRIGGAFRLFVGFVLTPLIAFDLPILWGKRSFKEMVSLTKLTTTENHFFRIIGPSITGILLLVALRSPYFDNFYTRAIRISGKMEHQTLANPKYNSNYFAWSFDGNLDDYFFIPDFKLISLDGVFQTSASLKIYHKITHELVTLSRIQGHSYTSELIKQAGAKDPFFSLYFGDLFDHAHQTIAKRYRGGDMPIPLSDDLQDDLERLYTYSLRVGNYSVFTSLLRGPFVGSYLLIKQKLLEEIEGIKEAHLYKINNQKFIRFDYNTIDEYSYYFLPYANNNYTFIYKMVSHSSSALNGFLQNFWLNSSWYIDYSEYFSINNFDPFYIIDRIAIDNSKDFNLNVYKYYYDLATTALKDQDAILQNILIDSLTNTIFLLENFSMEFSNPSLKVMLETIKVFLAAKDYKYFKI